MRCRVVQNNWSGILRKHLSNELLRVDLEGSCDLSHILFALGLEDGLQALPQKPRDFKVGRWNGRHWIIGYNEEGV